MEEGLCAYLSRHVSGGALGLQLEQALRDDLGALLTRHQLLQRAQDVHKHLTPQRQADQPGLSLHAGNPAARATAGCQPPPTQHVSDQTHKSELMNMLQGDKCTSAWVMLGTKLAMYKQGQGQQLLCSLAYCRAVHKQSIVKSDLATSHMPTQQPQSGLSMTAD